MLTLMQVMREMGFSYDPSTAGSSVRFDPRDPRDSVSFQNLLYVATVSSDLSVSVAYHVPQTCVFSASNVLTCTDLG